MKLLEKYSCIFCKYRKLNKNHDYACWANNHNGWRKMKKKNRRLFKKKYRREVEKDINKELNDMQ